MCFVFFFLMSLITLRRTQAAFKFFITLFPLAFFCEKKISYKNRQNRTNGKQSTKTSSSPVDCYRHIIINVKASI